MAGLRNGLLGLKNIFIDMAVRCSVGHLEVRSWSDLCSMVGVPVVGENILWGSVGQGLGLGMVSWGYGIFLLAFGMAVWFSGWHLEVRNRRETSL